MKINFSIKRALGLEHQPPAAPGAAKTPATPRSTEQLLKDFFIPKDLFSLLFDLICIAAAIYMFTYSLPQESQERACAVYWVKNVCPCISDPFLGSNQSKLKPITNDSWLKDVIANVSFNGSLPK